VESISAERFVSLLPRIAVYGGAVAFTARAGERLDLAPDPPEPAEPEPMVDIREAMAQDPLFMGLGTAVSVPAA
jgi:hypothetical protein